MIMIVYVYMSLSGYWMHNNNKNYHMRVLVSKTQRLGDESTNLKRNVSPDTLIFFLRATRQIGSEFPSVTATVTQKPLKESDMYRTRVFSLLPNYGLSFFSYKIEKKTKKERFSD